MRAADDLLHEHARAAAADGQVAEPARNHAARVLTMPLVSLALLLAVGIAHADDRPSPRDAARQVLRQKDFRFCRETTETVPLGDRDWCTVTDRTSTCPELQAMCARKAGDLGLSGLGGGGGKGGSRRTRKLTEGDAAGADDVHTPPPRWTAYVLHALLGVAIAVAVALLVHAWRSRRRGPKEAEHEPEREPQAQQTDVAPDQLGEVAQLLARARAMADRDLGAAHALLYAAALRQLELQGLIRWQKATTNREYLRAIRGRSPLHAPLQDLVREVERHKFGHVPPQRQVFENLITRLGPLLAALLLLVTTGCSGGGDARLSGRAAVWDVLRSQGVDVSGFSLSLAELGPESPPVFLDTDELRVDEPLLEALHAGVKRGGRVLLAAGREQDFAQWLPVAVTSAEAVQSQPLIAASPFAVRWKLQPDVQGWLPGPRMLMPSIAQMPGEDPLQSLHDAAALLAPDEATPTEAQPDAATEDAEDDAATDEPTEGAAPAALPTEATQVAEPPPDPGEDLLLRHGQPFAKKWDVGRGSVVVVADARLFTNGAMAVPGDVDLAVAVVRELIGADKRLAIARVGLVQAADSPAESMQRAGMWPLVLHALLALGLLLLARGVPFGVLRDRDLKPRRGFAEHVQALGMQLQRKRASRLTVSLYAGWALERLWQRHGRPGPASQPAGQGRDVAALAQAVARRLQRPVAEVADCLQRADDVRTLPDAADRPTEDLALLKDLTELLAEKPQDPTSRP